MADRAPPVQRKLQAQSDTVEDLVDRARRGLIRVPEFQRGLRWEAEDVIALFDSVYRGYPIGSLLLWQRPAPAGRIALGPLTVHAPETSSAWWVVDGQQRLTALAGGLARPAPIPTTPDDPYVVYFDAAAQAFHAPPPGGRLPRTWVPAVELFDAAGLSEWILRWPPGRDAAVRAAVFEAGKRLREYRVPYYLVEAADEATLREIFLRINNRGKRLEWHEVHDALYGGDVASPATIEDLAAELKGLGMGDIGREQLLSWVIATRGLRTTDRADYLDRDREALRGAVAETLPALRGALAFLRDHAEIPHLRAMSLGAPVAVLARWFAVHPEPSARTRELLTRFVWRAILAYATDDDEEVDDSEGIAAITDDEEASAQALLRLVRTAPTRLPSLPANVYERNGNIALVALASLGPRRLDNGEPIDVAAVMESQSYLFGWIVAGDNAPSLPPASPANCILYPGAGRDRGFKPFQDDVLARIERTGIDDPVLASHAISPRAAAHLRDRDYDAFLRERAATLEAEVTALCDRLAGWDRSDRPSIAYLLRQTAADSGDAP